MVAAMAHSPKVSITRSDGKVKVLSPGQQKARLANLAETEGLLERQRRQQEFVVENGHNLLAGKQRNIDEALAALEAAKREVAEAPAKLAELDAKLARVHRDQAQITCHNDIIKLRELRAAISAEISH